jgi:hypothetical protein
MATRRRSTDAKTPRVSTRRQAAVRRALPAELDSPTAVALEALRTGVVPHAIKRRTPEIPKEEAIQVGDPDDRTLDNEYVGDETPGGSASTPDQNDVDEIGRVYGLQEEDNGALQSVGDVLARRDRRRSELRPPNRR